MKQYNKRNNKGKYNGHRKKNREMNGSKNFNKKWHHDKFTEKTEQYSNESHNYFGSNSRNRYNGKKTKPFLVGKQMGKTRRVIIDCADLSLFVYENADKLEMEKKVNHFLAQLGLKFNDKTFMLFKIRIYFEIKKMEFKCFDQSIYFSILDRFEKAYMLPIK